jgi:glyoxylase-like metal-dependent hydrolase (beta-lactamase superfamily II)
MSLSFATSAFLKAPLRLLDSQARGSARLRVRWGVFIHPEHGPVLLDCGYGPELYAAPSLALKAYTKTLRPELSLNGAPDAVLDDLGFEMSDVHYIVLTHFHADHVCHLSSFPQAKVFVDVAEYATIRSRSVWQNILRGVFPELLPDDLFDRYIPIQTRKTDRLTADMGQGYDLFGDGSLITVPLPGHSPSHFGVLVDRPGDTPVLYAADTDWTMDALMSNRPAGVLVPFLQDNTSQAEASKRIVRNFARSIGPVVLCHDPELTALDMPEDGQ